jgi:hypothetical protein
MSETEGGDLLAAADVSLRRGLVDPKAFNL